MTATLLYVTQVAPYFDGPAGAHGVLGQSISAMAQMADLCGLELDAVDDVRAIDVGRLEQARTLALFTIGETPWSPGQRLAILERLQAGHMSVAAIHAATDSCYGWPEYGSIVGARFDGHPWTTTLDVRVLDHDHPATAHLGDTWHWHDEVYQFRDLRPDAQVLLAAQESQLDLGAPGANRPSFGFPLSWCFVEGEGRVFSTSLGHFPGAWESVDYLRHLLGGLRWTLQSAR